jgi:hypothetical protein
LAALGSISDPPPRFIPEGGVVFPIYGEGDLMLSTHAAFEIDSDGDPQTVTRVGFQARQLKSIVTSEGIAIADVFDSHSFGERVGYYMLPSLLSEQGPPTSVLIATNGGPLTRGGNGGFDILLLYPDQGLLVNYTTQMHLAGSVVRGCPSPSDGHVEMELGAPGQGGAFLRSLDKTNWAVRIGWYKSLEQATSTSVEEFYLTFREPTDGCIETPAEMWPIPEP